MATVPVAFPAAQTLLPAAIPRTTPLAGLRITFGGLLCFAIVTLVGLAGLNSEANLLYLLSGISLGVLAISAIAPLIMVRRIEIDRLVPDAVVAGRPFRVTYIIRNRRRYGNVWSLVVSERPMPARAAFSGRRMPAFPDAFAEFLKPGEEKRIEVIGVCPQRGQLTLPGVRVTSRFPFGLFACHVDFPISVDLMIYPPLGHFRHDPWRDYRASSTSSKESLRNRSGYEEFFGVREYRQGDNLRWIHWRRSARTGELVVREMIPLKPTQLIVLVDPWPETSTSAEKGIPAIGTSAELVISAAATALCDALEKGYRAGVVCRTARPIVIPPGSGRAQRQRILQELATAQPGAAEPLDALIAQIRWSNGWHARCLLCATSLNNSHERVVRFLNTRAEAVAILSPQKPDFSSIFEHRSESAGGGVE